MPPLAITSPHAEGGSVGMQSADFWHSRMVVGRRSSRYAEACTQAVKSGMQSITNGTSRKLRGKARGFQGGTGEVQGGVRVCASKRVDPARVRIPLSKPAPMTEIPLPEEVCEGWGEGATPPAVKAEETREVKAAGQSTTLWRGSRASRVSSGGLAGWGDKGRGGVARRHGVGRSRRGWRGDVG